MAKFEGSGEPPPEKPKRPLWRQVTVWMVAIELAQLMMDIWPVL